MRSPNWSAVLACLSSASACLALQPLIPSPQEIHYGTGRLALCSISVKLPPQTTSEDQFAGGELSSLIATHCGAGPRTAPFSLERTGAPDPLPLPGEKPGPESRESYSLTITASGGKVRARSSAGLFYAIQTIRQLLQGDGAAAYLPEVDIRDWPQFAYRGTMIDASHGPLPAEEEIKRQIDLLARYKANQYYLYSEASIELDGYPLLNPEGRYSKAQIRRLIAYARERHIDVVPMFELYGHIHDLLRIEHYSSLGSFPHGPEVDPANPEVMKVFSDWIAQFCDLFPSPFVHIGFDETWQIEMAAKKEGGEPADLFTRQLNSVAGLFQKRGKTVMAWADIVIKYPRIIERLPTGLVSVAWDYAAQPDIHKWFDPLVAANQPYFIATGVANWREIAVDFDLTFANIDNFLSAARKSTALGMMNTVWLDSSYSPLRMSWPTIAYGAAAAWQSAPMDRTGFFKVYAAVSYPPHVAGKVASALDSLNRSETTIQKVLGQDCYYELWESPFAAHRLRRSAEHREDLHQARLLAEDAQTGIYAALDAGGDPGTLRSLLFGARMLDYAAYRYLTALEIAERWQQIAADFHPDLFWHQFDSEVIYQSHSRVVDLMDAITSLREMYRSLWLEEYTPYRLGTTIGRFDTEYEYWAGVRSKFRNAAHGLAGKTSLPPLDEVLGERRADAVSR
jgi:hexosaminidase